MYGGAPPTAWADTGPLRSGPSPSQAPPPALAAGPEQLATAWKHVRNVVSADSRPADLYDLLSHSVRETQYSFQPQGVRDWDDGCCGAHSAGCSAAAAATLLPLVGQCRCHRPAPTLCVCSGPPWCAPCPR